MTEIGEKKPTTEPAADEEIMKTFYELCAGDMSNNRAIEVLIEKFGEKAVIKLMPQLIGQKEN